MFGVENVIGFGGAVMLASFNRHLVRVCRFVWWKGSVYGSSVLQECFVVEYEPEMVEEVFESAKKHQKKRVVWQSVVMRQQSL